jgi:malonyl CoA-acyl carrier protein transacylase
MEAQMTAFLFPGQGSQKKGRGQGLFDLTEYVSTEKEVDALLGYSMRELCLADSANRLKETQYTQPALYVTNALYHYKAVRDGLRAVYLAGHSLGEYNALLAGGAFDFLTGLRLVKKRGELMAQARNGAMAAIIGLAEDKIARVLAEHGLGGIDVANFNSSSQTVISGPAEDIRRAGPAFEAAGATMYFPLPVSAAFHSRYMEGAAKAFADHVAPMTFQAPSIPVIANVTAQPYPTENASESIKSLLVKQITGSVQWVRSIRYMLSRGVADFKEVGPGNVLTKLTQQIQQQGG